MSLTERQQKLINLLQDQAGPLTAAKLADQLKVSTKTIRNDINGINTILSREAVTAKAGAGYQIIGEFCELTEGLSGEAENLRFDILKELISKESCNFFELADSFYISESTLTRGIRQLNEVISLKNPEWCIKRENNQLRIPLDEVKRRSIYTLFLSEEIEEHKLSLAEYGDYFHYCEIDKLLQIVLDYHLQQHYQMNDFATIAFVLHIAVMMERLQKENYLPPVILEDVDSQSHELALGLVELLNRELDLTLPDSEIPYIYRLYSRSGDYEDGLSKEELRGVIAQVLIAIEGLFGIDFTQDQKLADFLENHLSTLYKRARSQQYLSNPLIGEIKKKFPFIYNVGVFAAAQIQQLLAIRIPDDEIAYLTLHFLSASENIRDDQHRTLLLVSPYGRGSLRLIRQQLATLQEYRVDITVKDSVLQLDPKDVSGFDLILSTAPLTFHTEIPVYRFDLMLQEQDLLKINEMLRKDTAAATGISQFLSPKLFFTEQSFSGREACIDFLSQQLIDNGNCPLDYTQQVLERERLSSTAFGNDYAIPHAIKRVAHENSIAVCTLKRPIDWDGKKVRLVLLLAFEPNSSESFSMLFSELAAIFDDVVNVRRLAKITDFQEFISTIATIRAQDQQFDIG